MPRKRAVRVAFLTGIAALWLSPVSAFAGGGGGCWYVMSLESALRCANTAAIAPGNDTRVNLNFLLRDERGLSPVPAQPTLWDNYDQFSTIHFGMWNFERSYWPLPGDGNARRPYGSYNGSRCQTVASGAQAFAKAMSADKRLAPMDWLALTLRRKQVDAICTGRGAPPVSSTSTFGLRASLSPAMQEFGGYLEGAQAFYAGEWQQAEAAFGSLGKARNPWVRDTAAYMLARNDINAAMDGAFSKWGDFLSEKAEPELARRAEQRFARYLKAYPQGLHADSAQGLLRRAEWLKWGGKTSPKLARMYVASLRKTDAEAVEFSDLLDEVDNTLLGTAGGNFFAVDTRSPGSFVDPLFIATWDLQRMRSYWDGETQRNENLLTAKELADQAPLFKGHEALFGLLQANHAYYVERDYRRVLRLIPDAARQRDFGAVEFSRQVLRGMALAQLGDRNEAGFWREMLPGSDRVWQRPLVELGLALYHERTGELDAVFSKGSPITDPSIRQRLLSDSAGPAILRAAARDTARPRAERRTAMRALLWKDLSRGRYADFVKDYALLKGFAADQPLDKQTWRGEAYPLDEFRTGKRSENITCPRIDAVAATLAGNARDPQALLCLGDFYRLNGFDHYGMDWWRTRSERELGSGPEQFPGEAIPRAAHYRTVLASRASSDDQKAYALYRSVRCYAPAGRNDCGGKAVEQSQRKAWFQQLKRQYPNSKWARDLEFYW